MTFLRFYLIACALAAALFAYLLSRPPFETPSLFPPNAIAGSDRA